MQKQVQAMTWLTALSSRRLGSMCRHGDRIWKVRGKMLSSPCLDLPGCPSTPTISPLLQLLCRAWNASKSSSDLLHSESQMSLQNPLPFSLC